MRFTKMQGAGNDFVVLDLRDGTPPPDAALAAKLGDRHFGVGCDQLLTIEAPRSTDAVAAYRIWNTDGTTAQQCGNGARCIAAWLVRDGAAPRQGGFVIESPAGRHAVARDAQGGFVIDMGAPQFAPQAVPLQGFADAQDEYALATEAGEVRFGAASMGNPHALVIVADIDSAPVERIGKALQRDAAFPQSVNVGFAEVMTRDRIRLRVFERGAGETLACGSGACAAVAVLARCGRVDAGREVAVELPGGTLRIRMDQTDGRVRMGGPATFVFEGEWFT